MSDQVLVSHNIFSPCRFAHLNEALEEANAADDVLDYKTNAVHALANTYDNRRWLSACTLQWIVDEGGQ